MLLSFKQMDYTTLINYDYFQKPVYCLTIKWCQDKTIFIYFVMSGRKSEKNIDITCLLYLGVMRWLNTAIHSENSKLSSSANKVVCLITRLRYSVFDLQNIT